MLREINMLEQHRDEVKGEVDAQKRTAQNAKNMETKAEQEKMKQVCVVFNKLLASSVLYQIMMVALTNHAPIHDLTTHSRRICLSTAFKSSARG